jgi:hypothetical protein
MVRMGKKHRMAPGLECGLLLKKEIVGVHQDGLLCGDSLISFIAVPCDWSIEVRRIAHEDDFVEHFETGLIREDRCAGDRCGQAHYVSYPSVVTSTISRLTGLPSWHQILCPARDHTDPMTKRKKGTSER